MRRTATILATALTLIAPACAKRAPDSASMAPSGPASAMGKYAAPAADGAAFGPVGEAGDGPMARAVEGDEEGPGFDASLQAGRLTAGVFDDALNPSTFVAFMDAMSSWNPAMAAFARPFAEITVVDGDGRPAAGVELALRQGTGIKRLVSGTDGRVVVFGDHDAPGQRLEVQIGGGQGTWSAVEASGKTTLRTTRRTPAGITALDLALVIDATGSMGDELEYIKVELRSIAGAIARDFPGVDQRYALVVYRDDGDEYVSRSFEFTGNLESFERSLGKQRADGGGDYPEAMDAALLDASELQWRSNSNTARVVFLVADAPPHDTRVGHTLAATDRLRAEGVGIYPVAASGVASEAEAVMRAAAVASGGQYVFLTDDSGVGNAHAEPHIPCYAVEPLRDAMTRMVRGEIAGTRIEADARRAVRTVGRGTAGVCEVLHRAG